MSSRQRLPKRGNKSIMAESEDLAVDPTTGDGLPMPGGSPSGGSFDGADNDRFIINGLDTASASVGDMSMSGPDGASGGSAKKNDRRHRCHLCGKRFNRPSSLKIHFTTHTGERPFPCLFPGCGRAFNVSSNMRRHYRTHVSGGVDGETAPPVSAPDFGAQNQQQYDQQQQQHQQAQPWSVNMYNPSTASGQGPRRARAKRAKGAGGQYQSQNNMEGEGSEEGEGEGGARGMGQNNTQPYPPMGPPGMYGSFPPPPMMNIPGMPGIPEMPGMPDLQAMQMQGIPMGVQMMPIEMAFPVDPALTAGDADMDADADAEGDADADADEDGDNDAEGEGEGEGEDSNRPQLTHSTSNTRASTMSAPTKTRSSARVQAKSKSTGNVKGKGKQAKANASTSTGASSAPGGAQQQVQFRQILVPVSVPMSGDPAQATRIAQQYQHQYAQQYAKYAQYAQYYMQSQPQGQPGQPGQPGTPGQAQNAARQSPTQTPMQPPSAPSQASTQNETAAQRLGPATSDERTAPNAPVQQLLQLHGQNEVVGRSVFVHWGPKEAKAKTEKQAEAHSAEQSAGAQTATDGRPADAAEGLAMLVEGLSGGTAETGGSALANVEPTSPNGSATDNAGAAEALSALASGIIAAAASASAFEQPVKDEVANDPSASTSTNIPAGDVEMEAVGAMEEEKGAEGDDAEEEGKPSSGSTPRKRRKITRGRGKARR